MALTFQCNQQDLREAIAAHDIWAKLDRKADKKSFWLWKIGLYGFVAANVVLMRLAADSPDYSWRVNPPTFILSALYAPFCVMFLVICTSFHYRKGGARASGVVQRAVPRPGVPGYTVWIGAVCWIISIPLLVSLFYFAHNASLRGATTAPSDVETIGLLKLPPAVIFGLGIFPLVLTSYFWMAIQKRLKLQQAERGDPTLFSPKTLQVDSEGLTLLEQNGHLRVKWAGIRRFAETDNLLMVYLSDQEFHLLPKRDLAAAGQLEMLMVLLTQHVETGVVRPHPPFGFPMQSGVVVPPPLPPPPIVG